MAVTQRKKSSYEEGSLDQYLRDISAYPLINREEEVRLAQRIRMDDQTAWKLLFNALAEDEAAQAVRIEGRDDLGSALLRARSVIV